MVSTLLYIKNRINLKTSTFELNEVNDAKK